jgi:succinoglycan biosynthesis transport protein ExoP
MIELLEQHSRTQRPASFATAWMTVRTTLYRYVIVLKRRWWIAFLTASLGIAIAAWYASQLPPAFLSGARMMVSGKINLPEGAIYSEELSNFFGTQTELMQSGEVRSRAFARVQALRPDLPTAPAHLSVGQQPRTSIFTLSVVSPDGAFARAYLDACMEEYIGIKKAMRSEKSQSTQDALAAELSAIETELREAREKLLEFQAQNNLGYLKEEGNSAGLYLSNLNRQYAELKTEHHLLQALTLDQALDRASPLSRESAEVNANSAISSFGPMADYQRARQQLQLLRAERDQLSEFMRPKHPDIVRLTEEISRTERLIESFRKQSIEQLDSRRDAIALQMQNLERAVKEWETKAFELSRKLAAHDRHKADVDRLQGLADRLTNNLRNVDMTRAVEQDLISILEKASTPVSIRPGMLKLILIGFGTGLIVGLTILFLMERIDDRISSIHDVQSQFSERIVGQVVHQSGSANGLRLLQPHDDRHSFSESFRALRSSLVYLPGKASPPKSILVTSAIPGEGKSTVSCNLAIAFALAGARTLLVDADLRRGGVHEKFDAANESGMAEILRDSIPWSELVRPTSIHNLSIITRGGSLPSPSEHFLAPVCDRFLQDALEEYDQVIVDSAPVMVAEDTPSLARKIDGVIVVTRFSLSSSRLTRRTLERLGERQANVLGLVLNDLHASMPEYSHYHYGSYYADNSNV